MNFTIKNRWSGSVIFSTELSAEVAGKSYSFQLRLAVKEALKAHADLTGANLTGADLTGADLRDANLTDANLTGADLTGADLTDANLTDANLTGADLTGADLTDANLTDANLTGADLTGAKLADANLTGAKLAHANLRGANLTDANLAHANLRGADLMDADLRDAELAVFQQDLIAEVLMMPAELDALRSAIVSGRIDGSTYSGECSCLAGTIAKAHGLEQYGGDDIGDFHAQASSPRERWFAMIKPGDTPETNQASRLALEWLDRAILIRDRISAAAVARAKGEQP